MCGLCGIVNFSGEPVGDDLLARMVQRVRHRGPDATGVARPQPSIGLSHARLKVIDLSEEANQPMASADRQAWIVYNGEVYNYRELRQELETQGRRFRTESDTEVILQAHEAWGEACVERLDGMFAFAIVDLRRQRLLLARDRAGKKPLFYAHDQRRIVFGSEIKALLAHPGVSRQINEAVLPLYLAYGYVPEPRTFYADIRSVPPATWMTVDLRTGAVQHDHYWQLQFPIVRPTIRRTDAIAGLRERLTDAVRKRMISDVPIGAFLSGGIDSTIVVGLMSRLRREPIHTLSIGFQGDARFDETRYARLAAQAIGSRHTEFVVKPDAFRLLERLVYHHDQPFGDASAIPTYLLCQLAREHVSVALTGDGGDEVFAGYRRFQAAVFSARFPRRLSAAAAGLLGRLPARVRARSRLGEWHRFFDAARRPWDERLMRWVSYFPEPHRLLNAVWRQQVDAGAHLAPVRHWLQLASGSSALSQALSFNFHEYLTGDLLVKMDRCSMAHGLEARSPFLDTAVIEYAAGLPDRFKLCGRRTKVILKEAFQDLLPEAIQRRGKWGFGAPLDTWFRHDLRTAVGDLLLAPDARLARFLEPAVVRRFYDDHQAHRRNVGLQLWNLLTLEVWLRMVERGAWEQADSAGERGSASVVTDVEVRAP